MLTRCNPIKVAQYVARRSTSHARYQIGAILTDQRDRIFSWGWAHPHNGKSSIHAEEHAIRRANPARLRGSTVIVAGYRVGTDRLICSRPCIRCHQRLQSVGVRKVIYSDYDQFKEFLL